MAAETVRRWLLMKIGIMAVGLGRAGIFLPLLRTTPFLLLAAVSKILTEDLKSGQTMEGILLDNPFF